MTREYVPPSPHRSASHCGCPDCQAWRRLVGRYKRRNRPLTTVDATGTRRRIQALACLGHTPAALARSMGRAPASVQRTMKRDRVTNATADEIRTLYDRWSNKPPAEDSPAAIRCRKWAAKKGFAPPMAWDDDSIDDPHAERADQVPDTPEIDETGVRLVMGGIPMRLTGADRNEAMRRLLAAKVPNARIAELLMMSVGAATKFRKRYRRLS